MPYAGLLIRSKLSVLRRRSPLRRWLREPLFHLLLIAAVLLIAARMREGRPSAAAAPDLGRIELTGEDYRQMESLWISKWKRPPSSEEMRRLIDERIREEILAREALAMGLERGDAAIRQRLAQKMQAFAEHAAADPGPASDAELRAWFAAHVDLFRFSGRISFRHLYFCPDKRGPHAPADAALALTQLAGRAGDWPSAAALGDAFWLQDSYRDCSGDQVSELFGGKFSRRLFGLKSGSWQGPIESSLGWHLVFIDAAVPSRVPHFEDVEAQVREQWTLEHRAEAKDRMYDSMKARYVVILPKATAGPSRADVRSVP